MDKKLYLSSSNKMLAGVCGGIAEYFSLDPTLVRLGWVVFVCLGGSGILAYIICVLIIPKNPNLY
jgi:phage shock protein C